MSPAWWDLLLISVLPVSFIFFLERTFVFFLGRKKNLREWVKKQFWLHPNFISRCRYPMGFLTVIIFYYGWQKVTPIWFGFWMITDITDGSIARYCQLGTKKGEVIDPGSDKLLVFPPMFYLAYIGALGNHAVLLVAIFFLFDLAGQFSRFFIANKAANLFGKAKTFLAVTTITLATLKIIYFPDAAVLTLINISLYGTLILSFCSMFFKVTPNYWYANILSILNFLCGVTGITLVLMGVRPEHAFTLVFVGQFLDLFDGRAAERWGSTSWGELLDDLADGTNFGGSIAFIVYSSLDRSLLGVTLGVIHFVCTVYRLIRFLVEKKKAGIAGGVSVFVGLPSPAGALIAGSAVLLFENTWVKVVIVIGASILMISRVPFIHFGREILPNIPKIVRVLLLTFILVAVLLSVSTFDYLFVLWAVLCLSIAYVVFGYPWKGYRY